METIAFARGVPAPEMLPIEQIREAASRALSNDGARVLSYGNGGGYPPLREHLADLHGVDHSQVIVTTGSLQGFAFLMRVLGKRGDLRVAVENPTYDRPLLVLREVGAFVDSLPVDADGLEVDRLATLESGTLVYTIPNFQNPGGSTLSESRRVRMLEIAARRGLPILEDNPYGELWFDTPPPPTLFERRGNTVVLYTASFSKTVSPGLRVGYLVVPPDLASELERTANDTYISASLLGQAAVHEFLLAGLLEPNIARVRALLQARCDAMCEALDEHLPHLEYVRPGGGYFLWADLPGALAADDLLPLAAQEGVSFVPGNAFGPGQERSLRLAFSYPSIDEIHEGVRRLARALERMRTRV